MTFVGDSGRAYARSSSIRLSRSSRSERLKLGEDVFVNRMLRIGEGESGIGAVKLQFNNLPLQPEDITRGDLPCRILDLTDLSHVLQSGDPSTVFNHVAMPWYVLNFNYSTSATNLFFRQETEKLYDLESYHGKNRNQQPWTVGASSAAPVHDEAIFDWADIRLRLFGVKNRNVRYTIQLVRMSDNLSPSMVNPMNTWEIIAANPDIHSDGIDRFNFWYNFIKPETSNDLLPRQSSYHPGYNVIKSWTYNIKQKDASNNEVNSISKKLFLKIGKLLRFQWRKSVMVPNLNALYDNNGHLDDAGVFNPVDYRPQAFVSPKNRLFLVIKATCPKSAGENADYRPVEGQNLLFNVPQHATMEGPFEPLTDDGTEVMNDAARMFGRGATTGQNVTAAFDINNPSAWGLPIKFRTVDAADIGEDGDGDAMRTETGTVSNIRDVRGQFHAHGAYVVGGVLSKELVGTIPATYVADPGADIPTFDFSLRMKYRAPS